MWQVHDPLVERTYTIMVFIVGACFFSAIYGNIAQLLQNLYTHRVARRMPLNARRDAQGLYASHPLLLMR